MVREIVQAANPAVGAVPPDAALPQNELASRPSDLAIDPKAQACNQRRRVHRKGN